MVRLAVFLFVLYAACAAGSAAQAPPNSPGGPTEPPPLVASGADASADGAPSPVPPPPVADRSGIEADFVNAKAKFDQGDGPAARVALEDFVARHPTDPARPPAEVLLARLALIRGDAAEAKRRLDALAGDPAVGETARYFLALAELRLGKPARARELLAPFLPKAVAAGSAPGPADESNIELYGALAEAAAGSGDPAAAIAFWDAYFHPAKDYERAFARQRAEQAAAQLSGEAAWRAFGGAPSGGLARAVLGPKAGVYLRNKGDSSGAAFVEGETAKARHALGFDEAGPRGSPGDPSRVGLAVPLSGKFQPVGEATLRAAMLATGALGDSSGATAAAGGPASQLVIRDTGTDPERAAAGIAELAHEEAVIGVLGAAEKKSGSAALLEATQDGMPLLALDDQAPGALSAGFQLIHAPEARVAELARRALKLGVRDFAILGPDSASGKRLREAFRKAVVAGGGRITAEATYVSGVTSFSGAVAALKRAPPQAVFVPDSSDRIELIAPALAFADLWPQPWGAPRAAAAGGKSRPRHVLLLSTANDLSPKLLQSAGRYVQGALLSPGFFADDGDDRSRAFVEAYRAAYGQDPHATEAYAFDGVRLLRHLVEAGARTRADMLRALAGASFEGLTGTVRFGSDHGRVDAPLVYVVDGDQIRAAR